MADIGSEPAWGSILAQPEWDLRVDAFWASHDEHDSSGEFDRMHTLVAERPADDADGLYEWASIHDSLGHEAIAVTFYRRALAAGLAGERLPQAQIQLASSLRNIGDYTGAIELLEAVGHTEVTGDARYQRAQHPTCTPLNTVTFRDSRPVKT